MSKAVAFPRTTRKKGNTRTVPKSETLKIRVTPQFREILKFYSQGLRKKGDPNWSESDVIHKCLAEEVKKYWMSALLSEDLQYALVNDLMP
jgi:hypothetical protein